MRHFSLFPNLKASRASYPKPKPSHTSSTLSARGCRGLVRRTEAKRSPERPDPPKAGGAHILKLLSCWQCKNNSIDYVNFFKINRSRIAHAGGRSKLLPYRISYIFPSARPKTSGSSRTEAVAGGVGYLPAVVARKRKSMVCWPR